MLSLIFRSFRKGKILLRCHTVTACSQTTVLLLLFWIWIDINSKIHGIVHWWSDHGHDGTRTVFLFCLSLSFFCYDGNVWHFIYWDRFESIVGLLIVKRHSDGKQITYSCVGVSTTLLQRLLMCDMSTIFSFVRIFPLKLLCGLCGQCSDTSVYNKNVWNRLQTIPRGRFTMVVVACDRRQQLIGVLFFSGKFVCLPVCLQGRIT